MNYDDEETEVQIEISDLIFEGLVLSSIDFINNLKKKKIKIGLFFDFLVLLA